MSAISLKSITGITSITTPAGVDNQLTLHTNNTTERVKIDVAGNVHVNNHLNIAGVTTVSDNIEVVDGKHVYWGTDNDLSITHNGTHGFLHAITGGFYMKVGNGEFLSRNGNQVIAKFLEGTGGVELYHNNVKKAYTENNGFYITDTGKAAMARVIAPAGYDARIDLTADTHGNEDNYRIEVNTDQKFRVYGKPGGNYTSFIELDQAGQVTLTRDLDVARHLDVDGHTNLDNVSIAGVTTATGNIHAQARIGIGINNPTQQFHIYGSGTQNALIQSTTDDIIRLQLKNSSRTINLENITGGTFRIRDGYTNTVRLQINAAGNTTVTGNLNVDKNLDVDGHTNLDNVSIAGVSTFTGLIDAEGGITVDDYLELFHYGGTNFIRPNNGSLDIINPGGGPNIARFIPGNGVELWHTASKKFNTTSTGAVVTGILTVSQDLDVDGHTNLDNVSVAGVTTITGSGNALEIVGGLVRCRNTASARFVANNGSAEGYFGWSSGVLTVGQAAATLSLEATGSNLIQLKTNSNERLRITSDGFIGINDSTPYTGLTINTEGDYWDTNGNTYAHPEGRVLSTWRGDRNDNTDYWVGFVGKYMKPSATVNILLQPHVGNFNNQAGMYIAGEATGNFSSDFTLGKINSGNVAGRGTTASSGKRATKSELLRIKPSGNLSLGNTHAAKKVHISTTGNQKILIDPNYNNNSGGSSNSEANANNIVESILIRTSFGDSAHNTTNAGHKWGIKFQGYNGNDFTQATAKCAGVFAVSEDEAGGYNRNVGLTFHTSPYNTAHREVMRLNTNGIVTKPYQYVFTVSTSGTSKNANWQKITGLTPDASQCTGVSDGTNWSNSTQRFTAPVTGVYHFFVGGWASSASNGSRYAYTFKHTNGNNYKYIGGGNYSLSDSPMDGFSRTIKLSAGEWVELWGYSSVSTTWGGGHHFFWGGYLLG